MKHAKTYPGADCGSDHVPVICTLQCKLKKLQQARTVKKLDFEQLKKPEIRLTYSIKVENKFEQLIDEVDEVTWESMKNILVETAEECVPKKDRRSKNKWMTQEILSMMSDRQRSRTMIPKNTEMQINSSRRNVKRPKKPGLIENVNK